MWNKIKFWLGLKCVVQVGDKWVITHRELGLIRSVLGPDEYSWPLHESGEFRNNFKFYRSREAAEEALKLMKSQIRMKP